MCFLSSADRAGRTGHGQLIGTAITLALVDATDPGHLAVPLRQRFTLGTVRLELIPSGRGFGAAALHVDVAGRTVLYAGAVRTSAAGVGDAAEVRTADTVVVAAPYGEPQHQFPPLAGVVAAAIDWTRAQLAAGRWPVLFVDTVLDGLEVASRLAAEGVPVAGGRALREAAQRITQLVPPPQRVDGEIVIGRSQAARLASGSQTIPPVGPELGSGIPVIAALGREPRAIVWLDAERMALTRGLGDRPVATALASARAIEGPAGYDTALAWAFAADRGQLLSWIEATGARAVFVTGACADAIVSALGARARIIGPPHQMQLFPREATS